MEDEKEAKNQENKGEKKVRNLKDATSLLKQEAIRRYKRRHKSSLDRHEHAIGDDFSKKSPAPKTPSIHEEDDDVFTPRSGGGKRSHASQRELDSSSEIDDDGGRASDEEAMDEALKQENSYIRGSVTPSDVLPNLGEDGGDKEGTSQLSQDEASQDQSTDIRHSPTNGEQDLEKGQSRENTEVSTNSRDKLSENDGDQLPGDIELEPDVEKEMSDGEIQIKSRSSTYGDELNEEDFPQVPADSPSSPLSEVAEEKVPNSASKDRSSPLRHLDRESVKSDKDEDTRSRKSEEQSFSRDRQTSASSSVSAADLMNQDPEKTSFSDTNQGDITPLDNQRTQPSEAGSDSKDDGNSGDIGQQQSPSRDDEIPTRKPKQESIEMLSSLLGPDSQELSDSGDEEPTQEQAQAPTGASEEAPAETQQASVDPPLTETKPEQQATNENAEPKPEESVPTEQQQAEDTTAEQAPAEQAPQQADAETGEPKPAESEQKPAESEQKPAEGTEQTPAETAEVEKPADGSEEQKPADSTAEQQPAEDQKPTEGSEEKPADGAAEQKPAETSAEQKPAEASEEQKPAEDSAEQKEAEAKEQKPAESAEQKPTVADGQDPATRGDEDELVSEHEAKDDEEARIPDDFFYNFDDHASRPNITDESGLPNDLLTLHHSFGYDCQKRANLHMLDTETALFAAGNLVQLLNFTTREHTYLRSTSGGGIGALAVHPSKKFFAVGEKGTAPNVNVFEYPSLKLCRILRGGTQESYSFVDFSPDGKLLASVGGAPDYMLTLWDWKQEKTVLRSKAFSQDVFRVTFSTELDGQLTSSGIGHIRFWKMARTFTGLKLQGQLGKFGKTEISDIEGYVELPDGKVLSGSEWGNLLLWDGGLIKVEISRKGRNTCHQGPIEQIIMDEGELMTIGEDGYIRVWDFETIDTADITDDSPIFEMEPMNELKVGNEVKLRSIVKSCDPEEPTMWFAQDANGGIWKLDLSFSFTSQEPEKLSQFHSGVIKGCDTSPASHLVATIGTDRRVYVYDYLTKQQLCKSKFNSPGSSLLWAPAIVDPKGATILAGFADGVVRVLNFQKQEVVDIHGKKKEDQSELALKQVFKPHNGHVTCMAIDNKGEILATGSDDNTVFFFNVGDTYTPIGFVKMPSAVTSLAWSPEKFEKATLVVTCKEGQALEIQSPSSSEFDTSHTFEITGLGIRTHQFKSIKSTLRHEEELERKAKEEEERKKREAEERRKRIERGLETESEQGDAEDEEDKEKEPEWEPFIPEEPSPILHALHGDKPGDVWLSVGEFDAGYLYETEFVNEDDKQYLPEDHLYHPKRSIPVTQSNDVPITCMLKTQDGKYLIMGMQNGSIRIQPIVEDDVGKMNAHWTISSHDNQYGYVSHVALSHDDKFLFSVGGDGNIFVYSLMDAAKIEEKVKEAKAKIPSARPELAEKVIADIEDPNAYSIEDAKQKSEHDKMMKLAEEKKRSVRHTIQGFRDDFKKLLEKNNELPPHLRLDRKEFEMDPEIKRQLALQTEQKIEHVKKEMAWEEEKHRIALHKLRVRFKDVVECERIVVKAFKTAHEVCSYRASKLPDDFYTTKAEMDRRKTTMFSNQTDTSKQNTQDMLLEKGDGQKDGDREDTAARITTTLKGSMGERITKALQKVEEKKKKRAMRRAQWSELMSEQPDENYESKEDVAAIREAKENMGDYKLKSAADYVVPDHLRMNTVKARARLLQLKDLLHQHKYDFNQRLLKLRDKKIALIEQIKGMRGELVCVQERLDDAEELPLPEVPRMHPEELPEKKFEYTRETLLRFKEELAERAKGGNKAQQSSFGGFGGAAGGAADKPTQPVGSPMLKKAVGAQAAASVPAELTPHAAEAVTTPLEQKLHEAEQIRLLYERDRLFREIDDMLANFDAELRCLRHEKFKLDIDLKNADLRHVTLFEEFLLLKDFEKHENVLTSKVETKIQEKTDMQNKILDVQSKLEAKKKDIEKLVEKEKALLTTFQSSLGDNNKFADYLTKVFKKKIKRSKKKPSDGDEDDDDSEEESSDESDWSESDEDEDSEAGGYDLDVCPPGCDQNIYDNTTALREKRLDIEEALAEEKKNRETFSKEQESLNKKSKVIDSGLKTAENELEAFQLEKQQKLNELDVVVTLKLHQIQHNVNGTVPSDLSQCLVFEQPGVVRLTHRIKELEHEKALQKKQMREAKKKHVQLIKDKRVFDAKIGVMNEQCNTMMVQKFGRTVDLEKLETVTVNRQIEELKEKLRVAEIQCSNEVTKWDEKIAAAKDDITDRIRQNTNRLDQLNMLLSEKKEYEKQLDSRQKNLGDEYGGVRKADVRERQRLIQLVHLQAQEIEALKEEITLLSRKGGHILPPAQPPLPNSAQARGPPAMPPT